MKMGLASKVYGHKKTQKTVPTPCYLQKNVKGHSISERKLNKKNFSEEKRNDLKVD